MRGRELGAEARALGAALAEAPAIAVGRVVALLDALPNRAEADAVLEAVRPRLRRLRPPRPLRFERLLFRPLDGVIVDPSGFRPGAAVLPRHALPPLAAAACAGLGPEAEAIAAACRGRTTADSAVVAELGGRLWAAAAALPLPVPPPGWEAAGLRAADAGPLIAGLCVPVWRHASRLWALFADASDPPEQALREALAPLAGEGAVPLLAAMALLMRQLAMPATVLAVGTALLPGVAERAERALADALREDVTDVRAAAGARDLAEAVADLSRRLDDAVAAPVSPAYRDARRRQIESVRRDAATLCDRRLDSCLNEDLIAPLGAALAGAALDDAAVAALEAGARDMRRLEANARRLGAGGPALDAGLRGVVTQLTEAGPRPGGLTLVDLVRLIEILAGSDAAEAALAAAR